MSKAQRRAASRPPETLELLQRQCALLELISEQLGAHLRAHAQAFGKFREVRPPQRARRVNSRGWVVRDFETIERLVERHPRFRSSARVSVAAVAEEAYGAEALQLGRQSACCQNVGRALQLMGFRKCRGSEAGARVWLYERPAGNTAGNYGSPRITQGSALPEKGACADLFHEYVQATQAKTGF